MKNAKKALLLVLCVVLLVVSSVFGTLAYLTDNEAVVNTFTVGQIDILLDEKDTDNDADASDVTPGSDPVRDKHNVYHLIPGEEYVKDPIVHVDADSESCYLYIQVDNQITAIEATDTEKLDDGSNYVPVATQITNNGWILMDADAGLYYKVWTKDTSDEKQPVFANFKISDNANNAQLADHAPVTTGEGANAVTTYKNIKVTAYAIQLAGFENNPTDAWTALTNQLAANS